MKIRPVILLAACAVLFCSGYDLAFGAEAPANDNFVNSKRLIGIYVRDVAFNTFATIEDGEPEHSGVPGERSLWWAWKAQAHGTLFIKVESAGLSPHLIAVYTGSTMDAGAIVALGYGSLHVDVARGISYQIVVDDSPGGSSANRVALQLALRAAPSNDDFARRRTLRGERALAIGTVVGATRETTDPTINHETAHTVWWRWVAPKDGRYSFTTTSTTMNPFFALFRKPMSEGTLMDLPKRAGHLAQINLPLEAGEVIAISVDGDIQSPRDRFRLAIRKTPPPPNDDFENRRPLVNGSDMASNEGATVEPGEPGIFPEGGGASLWWRFTPATNGYYQFHTEVRVTNASPVLTLPIRLRIFAGDSFESLSEMSPFSFAPGYIDPSFLLSAGSNYAIQVLGYTDWFGQAAIRHQLEIGPVNDHFTNSIPVPGFDLVWASVMWATREPDDPITGFDAPTAWWHWTAPSNGLYVLETYPDELLEAYTLWRGGTLEELSAIEMIELDAAHLLFTAFAGITYHICAQSEYPGNRAAFRLSPAGLDVQAAKTILNSQ